MSTELIIAPASDLTPARLFANHASPRMSALYDRSHDEISLNEVEQLTV